MNNIDPKSKAHIDHEFLWLNKKPYPQKTIAQLHAEIELAENLQCPHQDHEDAHLRAQGKLPKQS